MLPGIDVSNYSHANGQPIDWAAVKAAGAAFVFILATDGFKMANGRRFVNPYFSDDWRDAQAAGLRTGAYHYFRAREDVQEQIDQFLGAVGQLSQYDMLMGDFEDGDGDIALPVLQFEMGVAQRAGVPPLFYSGPAFMQDHGLTSAPALAQFGLNYAWWSAGPPTAPAPWPFWAIWQQGQGTYPGVPGPVDLCVFNGDMEQLERYGYRGAEPPLPEPSDSLKTALQQIYDTAGQALFRSG